MRLPAIAARRHCQRRAGKAPMGAEPSATLHARSFSFGLKNLQVSTTPNFCQIPNKNPENAILAKNLFLNLVKFLALWAANLEPQAGFHHSAQRWPDGLRWVPCQKNSAANFPQSGPRGSASY